MSKPNTKVVVPWTDDQVESLNAFQGSGVFHPYTGRNDLLPSGTDDVLVAKNDGWHSRVDPKYHQTWAWTATADWSWQSLQATV